MPNQAQILKIAQNIYDHRLPLWEKAQSEYLVKNPLKSLNLEAAKLIFKEMVLENLEANGINLQEIKSLPEARKLFEKSFVLRPLLEPDLEYSKRNFLFEEERKQRRLIPLVDLANKMIVTQPEIFECAIKLAGDLSNNFNGMNLEQIQYCIMTVFRMQIENFVETYDHTFEALCSDPQAKAILLQSPFFLVFFNYNLNYNRKVKLQQQSSSSSSSSNAEPAHSENADDLPDDTDALRKLMNEVILDAHPDKIKNVDPAIVDATVQIKKLLEEVELEAVIQVGASKLFGVTCN